MARGSLFRRGVGEPKKFVLELAVGVRRDLMTGERHVRSCFLGCSPDQHWDVGGISMEVVAGVGYRFLGGPDTPQGSLARPLASGRYSGCATGLFWASIYDGVTSSSRCRRAHRAHATYLEQHAPVELDDD